MATIEQRITSLELARGNAPMLALFVTDKPTPEQAAQIAKAERTGRMMIVFVARGDTAWIVGSGKPAPWEQQEGGEHGNT